jgi:hypothetical protein
VCELVTTGERVRPPLVLMHHAPSLSSPLLQGKVYLDALPYIDGEMDPGMRARVDNLILEEMQNPRFPRR